jgi:hypothetical protein
LNLETNPVYPSNPGIALGRRFLEHVKSTGQPETFPTISTERPPAEGELVVLASPVEIDSRLRPLKDMAPCPVCLPSGSRWLALGRNAPDQAGWQTASNIAENLFLQEERERQNAAELAQALGRLQARIDWIDRVSSRVDRVDELQNRMAKMAAIRKGIFDKTRGGGPVQIDVDRTLRDIGFIRGAAFLRSTWRDRERLQEARVILTDMIADAGHPDLRAWTAALAPVICAEKLAGHGAALETMRLAMEHVDTAAAFLSVETANTLAALSPASTGTGRFRLTRQGDMMGIEAGDKAWHARIGEVTALPAIP